MDKDISCKEMDRWQSLQMLNRFEANEERFPSQGPTEQARQINSASFDTISDTCPQRALASPSPLHTYTAEFSAALSH